MGMLDDSTEAARFLVTLPDAWLVVDGYNVARTAWQGIGPEEERSRTVAVLEELQARTGATVIVVFDGDDDAVAPVASRRIRVQFSPSGITADDVIVDLVAGLPVQQAVVVVSSDRAVARDSRAAGAAVVGSAAFLAAVGR